MQSVIQRGRDYEFTLSTMSVPIHFVTYQNANRQFSSRSVKMLPDKVIIKMNVAFADFNFCDRVAVENFQNRLNKISI